MRILGLLGVWLWLGTLLANAGSAEAARIRLAVVEEWSAQAPAVPALVASKADVADKDAAAAHAGQALALSPWPNIFPAQLTPEDAEFFGAGARAFRRLLIAWHLGRGPPAGAVA